MSDGKQDDGLSRQIADLDLNKIPSAPQPAAGTSVLRLAP